VSIGDAAVVMPNSIGIDENFEVQFGSIGAPLPTRQPQQQPPQQQAQVKSQNNASQRVSWNDSSLYKC
jgi:hypothetical protein